MKWGNTIILNFHCFWTEFEQNCLAAGILTAIQTFIVKTYISLGFYAHIYKKFCNSSNAEYRNMAK